ncbi:MAG TPA: hypothetical protein VFA77_17235 [Candidatus Eisenbacteria bacterium]|nr:hypothetical protein [Candidatus Eisenbacteria bacterium]
MNQDLDHLRLLSIFHYVAGGMIALFACIPIIHVGLGVMMLVHPAVFGGHGQPPPPFIGLIFVIVGGAIILFGWLLAALVVISGRFLARHQHHTYCLVVAALSCLFMPVGTVLGVFTIIVLTRPSVKALFQS